MRTEKKGESPDHEFVLRGVVIVIVSMCVINSLLIPLAQEDGKSQFSGRKGKQQFLFQSESQDSYTKRFPCQSLILCLH